MTLGLWFKTLARRRGIKQIIIEARKSRTGTHAGHSYLQLSTRFSFEERSRVQISLTAEKRHDDHTHVHTIIYNHCTLNVDHWHRHVLCDSRLRSSGQLLDTCQGKERHSGSKTKRILCFTPAFVTAHYKLVRED